MPASRNPRSLSRSPASGTQSGRSNSAKSHASSIPDQHLNVAQQLALTIDYIPPSELKPSTTNARVHSEQQIAKIAESLKAFGFVAPVVVDASSEVIIGHGRLAAALLAGLPAIPVVRIDHLSDAQTRALRIADNRLAELSNWDEALLASEFTALLDFDPGEINFEVEVTGFSFPEIDQLIEAGKDEDDADPDDQLEPGFNGPTVSRLGDIWILGEHSILCGDARENENWQRLVGASFARTAICDVPYNVPSKGHMSGLGKIVHDDFVMASGEMSEAEFTQFLIDLLRATAGSLVDGGVLFVFMDWRHMREVLDAARAIDLTLLNLSIWNKISAGMGSLYRSQHELVFVLKRGKAPHKNCVELGRHGRTRTNVWNYRGLASFGPHRREQLSWHPTVKNCAMIGDAIRDVSDRGDLVIDPCGGSGTTIIAAAKTGRQARIIELDPKYVDVTVRRWEKWSGQTARHGVTGRSFAEEAAFRTDTAPTRDAVSISDTTATLDPASATASMPGADPAPTLYRTRLRKRQPVG